MKKEEGGRQRKIWMQKKRAEMCMCWTKIERDRRSCLCHLGQKMKEKKKMFVESKRKAKLDLQVDCLSS